MAAQPDTEADLPACGYAMHLGVNALALCFGDQLPEKSLTAFRRRVERDCAKLDVRLDIPKLTELRGNLQKFSLHKHSISRQLRRQSVQLAACFELGVTLVATVFGRDRTLANGTFDSQFLPALRHDAQAAGVPWAILEEFIDLLRDPRVDGRKIVGSALPTVAEKIAASLQEHQGHPADSRFVG